MKTVQPKIAIVAVTDPDEIASIERNGTDDIFGWRDASGYWAQKWSVERYREAKQKEALLPSETNSNVLT
jgi:hypothetical protein